MASGWMDVTAEDVRSAALAAGVTRVDHHPCAICDTWVKYRVIDGFLYFDADCECLTVVTRLQPRNWQDAADWINMQIDVSNRLALMQAFGIKTE